MGVAFEYVDAKKPSPDAPPWFLEHLRPRTAPEPAARPGTAASGAGSPRAHPAYNVSPRHLRPESAHFPEYNSINHNAPSHHRLKGVSVNPANYGRQPADAGQRPDYTTFHDLACATRSDNNLGGLHPPRLAKGKVPGFSGGAADTMLGGGNRAVSTAKAQEYAAQQAAFRSDTRQSMQSRGSVRSDYAGKPSRQISANFPHARMENPTRMEARQRSARALERKLRRGTSAPPFLQAFDSSRQHTAESMAQSRASFCGSWVGSYCSTVGSDQIATAYTPKPQFRDAKGWKVTPGGTGLYSMSTPRRMVTTVTQRPTTALYGDAAKEAYFRKYPGAPSPLLQELWVKRDEYNFRVQQQHEADHDTIHGELDSPRPSPPTRHPEGPWDGGPVPAHGSSQAMMQHALQPRKPENDQWPLDVYLMPTPQVDSYEDPLGLWTELDVRLHTVVQDHPEIAKVTQQNSGARRLGQTGKLYVEIEVTYNKGLEPGSKRKGEVVHRWESSEMSARRVRDNMGQLEGCMLGGLGGGSQRQATWAHPDSSSTTSLRGNNDHVVHLKVLEKDVMGKPTLLGKTTISVLELVKSIDLDPCRLPVERHLGGSNVPRESWMDTPTLAHASHTGPAHGQTGRVEFMLHPRDDGQTLRMTLYVTKRTEGYNLERVNERNPDLDATNRALGYLPPKAFSRRLHKGISENLALVPTAVPNPEA